MDSYVLEIPDLGYVLTPQAISRWQLFWRQADNRFWKVKWRAVSSDDALILNIQLCPASPLRKVQIDFKNNRIVITKDETEEQEFELFLRSLMDSLFILVQSTQMHFIVSPNGLRRHNSGIAD